MGSCMRNLSLLAIALLFGAGVSFSQPTGSLRGKVVLNGKATPLQGARVLVGQTGRMVETGPDGSYEITGLAPGTYTVTVHLHSLTDEAKSVTIAPDQTAVLDFALDVRPLRQQITVTARGIEQSVFESFQTVTTIDSLDLATRSQPSLGEVLDQQPGVAKRSFGVGNSRPVIRGFDGDRVLIMTDGMPTGTLSSQSGDHGESVDPSSLDRLEVVKGPATLLYGSNALGGVVNAITGHHQAHPEPHPGVRGYVTGLGGTTNNQGGGSGGFEFGVRNWLFWGGGGGQRTGDYNTAQGRIENSHTRLTNTFGGGGWYGRQAFFDAGYRYEEGRFGVPFAGEFHGSHEDHDLHGGGSLLRRSSGLFSRNSRSGRIRLQDEDDHDDDQEHELVDLDFRRHNFRFSGGMRKLAGALESFRLSLNYSDWQHRELEGEEVGTRFNNRQVVYRGTFEQARRGRLSGSFGFQGMHRDYKTAGAEALAPPVIQNNFAVFGMEEIGFERFRLQFGGRIENNQYDPTGLRSRSFTGFSGAAGIHVPAWRNGAMVANYTHSYRAPALEELYNRGPHIGNLTYEIGNPDLQRERADGIDLSLRHRGSRIRAEANFFYYDIRNFVYLAPTGEIEDGLVEANWSQADSRFTGGEAGVDFGLLPNVWLNLGMDYVNAQLKVRNQPLPRIPPLRGRGGLDFRFGRLSVRPQLLAAGRQDRVFETETPTPGYAVFHLGAQYTVTRPHVVHVFSGNLFNAGDRLYRNHLSFIKDLAPEIGRGFRFTYTMRFF